MEKSKKAFTLVELIVWITISIILMASVWVFVWDTLRTFYAQEKAIDSSINYLNFYKKIQNIFEVSYDDSSVNLFSSWVLFKLWKNYYKKWFSFIWEKSFENFYCFSGAEDIETKHLIVKTFIPFEWIWADIFAWTNYSSWNLKTNYFSWTVIWEDVWKYLWPTDIYKNGTDIYISDNIWNSILKNGEIIIWWKNNESWRTVFSGSQNLFWTWIYLNNPSWLTYGEWKLFVSDTWNNRILAYDIFTKQIHKILGENDWLNEVTWLFYDNSLKRLFISNSASWEILEFSSPLFSSNPDLNIKITPESNFIAQRFSLEFYTGSIAIPNSFELRWPDNVSSVSFSWITNSEDFIKTSSNKLDYYFVEYNNNESSQPWCNNKPYELILWNPVKCISYWTWKTSTAQSKSFIYWNTYEINISNIIPKFNWDGSDYVILSLFDWNNKKYEEYFYYFKQGDNRVFTTDDNTLKTIASSLGYPTGISFNWNNLIVNDFISRKQKTISLNWNILSQINLDDFDFSSLAYNKYSDFILKMPISNLKLDYTDGLLTLISKYYKSYDCYNIDEKIEKILFFKKYFER